jgi:hypothetical protein
MTPWTRAAAVRHLGAAGPDAEVLGAAGPGAAVATGP